MMKNKKLKKALVVMAVWRKEGQEVLPNGIPVHPEFVYRETGEWQGWSDFLGHKSKENDNRDIVEDLAYELMQN